MPPVLRVLGPVEVVGPDGSVALGGAKERCLLAALAVHSGAVVGEDQLVDALWDGAPPRTAAKTLQNYVMRVRRRLEGLDGIVITTRPPGYLLDGAATDVRAVESLVARGRQAAAHGDHGVAAARYEEALGFWRGRALAEFADRPWACTEAARLDELRESVVEERMAALLDAGRHHDVIAECEKLVAELPLRERRWAQLMVALYRDGRQGDALDAFRRLRAVLAEQLGVRPGPEAERIEAAILAQDAVLMSVPARQVRRRSAGCLGRDQELATLVGHLAEATDGQGRVTLVAGEPGIGKSTLLAELAARAAERGAQVLAGRCLEGSGTLPFHPFVEAVEGFLDGREPPPGAVAHLLDVHRPPSVPTLQPDELRFLLLDGVARFLVGRAAVDPVVLLVDDLHWADDGTVAMLRHVARRTPGQRLLVVGAYRDSEVTVGHPLEDALGTLRSEAECTVLRLSGLGRGPVAELFDVTAGATAAPDLLEAVFAETRGNPFFVREVARHLAEDGALRPGADGRFGTDLPLTVVPDGVRQVIVRRRRRLSAEANRLIDVASAVEGPFLYEPVRTAAGLSDVDGLAALDEVLQAGLCVPDAAPDRYDFTHALVRHTVYGAANPSRRLRIHRDLAVATAAARSTGSRVSAAEIATQFHRSAGLPGAAAGVAPALEAAERAAAAGAHGEQATFLQVACELLPAHDDRRADLLGRCAVALAWALRFDDAVRTARAAVAAGAGVDRLAAVAMVLATAGSNSHAWQLAAGAATSPTRSGTDHEVAWSVLTLLDLERREAADPDHPGMPLDLPGRRAALRVLHESGRLSRRGDLARYAVAAIHGGREQIGPEAAADPTVAAYLVGDYAAAVPLFAVQADAGEAHGQLAWAIYSRAGQARCLAALGELAAAAEVLDRCRELVARLPGLPLGWQLMHLEGAIDALTMALDEGWRERLGEFAPWMAPGPDRHWGGAGIAAIGARCLARAGDERAVELLARPVRALRTAPAWAPNYTRTACEVAETLWLLDRRDHLAAVAGALRAKALPSDFRFPMTDARLALARLCALAGDRDEASTWFTAARDVLDAQGARPLRAVVDHDEALMHLRAGDRRTAAPLIDAARTAFAQLGMNGWMRRLAAEVR